MCIENNLFSDNVASAELCLCLGVGVVVAERSEALTNQT